MTPVQKPTEIREQEPDPTCSDCLGDGWYIGHDEDCYEQGDCVCSGVQVWCQRCHGSGRLDGRLERGAMR